MDEIFKDDEGRLCQRDGLAMEVHKQGEEDSEFDYKTFHEIMSCAIFKI